MLTLFVRSHGGDTVLGTDHECINISEIIEIRRNKNVRF